MDPNPVYRRLSKQRRRDTETQRAGARFAEGEIREMQPHARGTKGHGQIQG